MSNEWLFLISALVDIFLVFLVAQRAPDRLFGVIAMNLILISIFGGKFINIFGFVTNAGNVFYACVFLATHFLLERTSKENTLPTIWFGAGAVFFFIVLSQLAVYFGATSPTSPLNAALGVVFALSPRIAFASILSYIFAQYINIALYSWIKEHTKDKFLWLRSNGANIVAQLADSAIFFTVAFLDLPGGELVQAILIGWAIKTAVVVLGTPFLYLDRHLRRL